MQDINWIFYTAIAVGVGEFLATVFWWPTYFRSGLPLIWRSVDLFEGPGHPVTSERLHRALAGSSGPEMLFRSLGDGEIAFRETLWNFGMFRYVPIMHGMLRLDPSARRLSVVGYANWTLLAGPIAVWAVYEGMEFKDPFYVAMLCAFLVGGGVIAYVVQRRRYIRIFDLVKNDCQAAG